MWPGLHIQARSPQRDDRRPRLRRERGKDVGAESDKAGPGVFLLLRCEFCGDEAEWKVFIVIKRVMAKSRRSYLVTRPSGRQDFISRDRTTFRKLDSSYVVRIPAFFKERGTPVCESCSLKDDLFESNASSS